MGESIRTSVIKAFGEPKSPIDKLSPLTYAFIGDAVYSLVISTIVVNDGNTANKNLHTRTSSLVSANAQASLADALIKNGVLTEEEQDIYKRGKNAKPKSHAKNADINVYHKATGLETLAGYLYELDRVDRLIELVKRGIEIQSEDKTDRK